MHTIEAPHRVEVFGPHGTKLYLREETAPSITKGGLHLPQSTQRNMETGIGEVMDVGPGWRRDDGSYIPLPWVRGDRIVFLKGRFACKLTLNEEAFTVLDEMDVLGKVTES